MTVSHSYNHFRIHTCKIRSTKKNNFLVFVVNKVSLYDVIPTCPPFYVYTFWHEIETTHIFWSGLRVHSAEKNITKRPEDL